MTGDRGAFLVFCAAATAMFLRLVTWGVGPVVAFLLVSAGAARVTLGMLLVCTLRRALEDMASRYTQLRDAGVDAGRICRHVGGRRDCWLWSTKPMTYSRRRRT